MQNLGRFQFNFPKMIYCRQFVAPSFLSGTSGGRQALTTLTIVFGRSSLQCNKAVQSSPPIKKT